MEEKIEEIIKRSLQIKVKVYDSETEKYIATMCMYPLPQVGNILQPYLDDNEWRVTSIHFHERDHSWNQDCAEWIIFAEKL